MEEMTSVDEKMTPDKEEMTLDEKKTTSDDGVKWKKSAEDILEFCVAPKSILEIADFNSKNQKYITIK